MQDKFSIGPVTIVQLVGIIAKPRIASAQADGAVRAADPIPPSAAAGLGDDIIQSITEVASSYLNLKAAPVLGLSADPVRGNASFDAGVDRPIADTNAPVSAIDQSTFEEFLPNNILPNAPSERRDVEAPPGSDPVPTVPDTKDHDPSATADSAIDSDYVFDGVESFGDDEILDFTIEVSQATALNDSADPFTATSEFDHMLFVSITDDLGEFLAVDLAAELPSDLPVTKDDLVLLDPYSSAIDAVPVI